jgi:hypothetical protein
VDSRRLSDDIVILREPEERAVLVRGRNHVTAIDVPSDRETLGELMDASRNLAKGGIKLAILTRAADDTVFGTGVKVWRGDEGLGGASDTSSMVQLIQRSRTLRDDAGRSFHVEPSAGAPGTLAVRIEPERVLVVCDDLQPGLPPRLGNATVEETIRRYEGWIARAPLAIVPASGIPVSGDQMTETLQRGIEYLRALVTTISVQMAANRYPWERLIHSIPWCAHWPSPSVSPALYARHRANVRDVARDLLRQKYPESADLAAA